MSPLASLALATAAFVASHFLLSHPLRPGLVARLGERGFLGLYSLVAFATLVWMIFAWRRIEQSDPLWMAPLWWWPIASGVILIAAILFAGSLVRNPALPHPGAEPKAIPAPRGVYAITRHPMNWSFMLWALVHISVSGNPRNLIVAGGILALAFFGSLGQDARKERMLGDVWRQWQAKTSFIPFAALLSGRLRWRSAMPDWFAIVGGAALWAVVTSFHVPLVSPLGELMR